MIDKMLGFAIASKLQLNHRCAHINGKQLTINEEIYAASSSFETGTTTSDGDKVRLKPST